jgi:hypothetical protein
VAMAAAALGLAACSAFPDGVFTNACPAIGYTSVATVELVSAPSDVVSVTMCDSQSPTCATTEETTQIDDDSWEFNFITGPAPVGAVLSAYAADGTLLYEQTQQRVDWQLVGTPDACGGAGRKVLLFFAPATPSVELGSAAAVAP